MRSRCHLRPGNLVYVTRADRRTAVFRVTEVSMYPENAFPANLVYGRGLHRPVLRLVTCGGQFDWQTHRYLSRIVVFAAFTGHR